MDRVEAIKTALAKKGLRPAYGGESGWVVPITIDGEPARAWATDAPEGRAWTAFEFPDPARATRFADEMRERGDLGVKHSHRVVDVDLCDDSVRAAARFHSGTQS